MGCLKTKVGMAVEDRNFDMSPDILPRPLSVADVLVVILNPVVFLGYDLTFFKLERTLLPLHLTEKIIEHLTCSNCAFLQFKLPFKGM